MKYVFVNINAFSSQIKNQMKRKAYEEAGLTMPDEKPVKQQKTTMTSVVIKQQTPPAVTDQRQKGST